MIFSESPLANAWVIELDRSSDERGWFARTFDTEAFEQRGLEPSIVQCSASFNERSGTLRGMHFQREPHAESKLVRCTRGAIYDVIVDLRAASPTQCCWFAVELSQDNGRMLYVPPGCAHGFQTLADDTEVSYQMGQDYVPSHAAGVRWDDPRFGIEWPSAARVMSDRDRTWPDFRP